MKRLAVLVVAVLAAGCVAPAPPKAPTPPKHTTTTPLQRTTTTTTTVPDPGVPDQLVAWCEGHRLWVHDARASFDAAVAALVSPLPEGWQHRDPFRAAVVSNLVFHLVVRYAAEDLAELASSGLFDEKRRAELESIAARLPAMAVLYGSVQLLTVPEIADAEGEELTDEMVADAVLFDWQLGGLDRMCGI